MLTHGTVRGDTLEAQGEGLNALLILVEGIGRPPVGNSYPVCVCQPLPLLAYDFASQGTVGYKKAMRNKLGAAIFTG